MTDHPNCNCLPRGDVNPTVEYLSLDIADMFQGKHQGVGALAAVTLGADRLVQLLEIGRAHV